MIRNNIRLCINIINYLDESRGFGLENVLRHIKKREDTFGYILDIV